MIQDEGNANALVPKDKPLDVGLITIKFVANGAEKSDGIGYFVEEVEDKDAQETIRSALSDNTIRIYNASLRAWSVYAFDRGLRPLPASESAIINYLQSLARHGKTLSTIKVVAAALSKAHILAGFTSPVESARTKLFMRGLSRRIGKPQKQAAPLDDHALSAIEATALTPRRGRGGRLETLETARLRGLVDVAIVRVISDAALRRSEAVSLDWEDVTENDRGGIIMVKRSKTDVAGEGATVWISRKAMNALNAIRPDDWQPTDPVFTAGQSSRKGFKGKYRMSGEQLNRRVAAAARAAGLGEGFSGHSGRVGFVARATRLGAPTDAVMRHARWKSSSMVANYGRNEVGSEILKYISL